MNLGLAVFAAILLVAGLTLYAVLGGADVGTGSWDLTAGRGTRAARMRALLHSSMGPVWEANHVWLIFTLVVFWTSFPTAFASVMSTMYIPLFLVVVGIILRGSSYAFRPLARGTWFEWPSAVGNALGPCGGRSHIRGPGGAIPDLPVQALAHRQAGA